MYKVYKFQGRDVKRIEQDSLSLVNQAYKELKRIILDHRFPREES